MTRKRLLVVLFALVALAAGGTLMLWPRPSRITEQNYGRIRRGMSRSDVEAILGPPGDYRTGETRALGGFIDPGRQKGDAGWQRPTDTAALSYEWWAVDTGVVGVWFTPTGLAVWKSHEPCERREQSSRDRLLRQLKQAWKRLVP